MHIKTEQNEKKLLEEKIKAIPIEQQNYIKGLIDGALMGASKKSVVKMIGGQAV